MRADDKQVYNIMIIDDTPENLDLLQNLLGDCGYRIMAFPRGRMAINAALRNPPDLILLDINMPEMDGYEVCQRMKSESSLKDIPILFISANNAEEDKVKGFMAGGVDYVTKPFQTEELKARIGTHLSIVGMKKELEKYNRHLESLVQEKVKIIEESHISTILAIIKLTEQRDNETGQHIDRTKLLCKMVAEKLKVNSQYSALVTEEFINDIYNSAALHDIGKIGIPDSVLLKPGKIAQDEWEIMKRHTEIGANILDDVLKNYGHNSFLKMGREIAYSHHEKWDGSGYPVGAKKDAIPLCARIMSLVDVYDALRSVRPYKEAFSHSRSMNSINEGANKHFDPVILSAFHCLEKEIEELYN